MNQNSTGFQERADRVHTAIRLEKPDRVPFVPMVGNFYAMGYGVSVYDAMKSRLNLLEPMERYCRQYDPDLLALPTFYPIDLLEASKPVNMRWPGETHNLPTNTPFQYLDKSFIVNDEDWEFFLRDPSLFLLTKTLPEKYEALAGLRLLNPYALAAPTPFMLFNAGLPPVNQALLKLAELGELTAETIGECGALAEKAAELGYPTFGACVPASPFDDLADSQRGLVESVTDLYTDPERFAEAVERWGAVSIPYAVQSAKMSHAEYAMIPAHCGIDEFISPENYSKYYWPPLKKLLTALIEADITPLVITQGHYNTRLEQLCDVPKGKVVYFFENVDMKRAKDILGGTACIAGNIHTSYLISGSVDRVKDETKRLIDTCAPGGGYIMSNSLSLDNADHRLVEAWHETTVTYGKY